MRKLTLNHEIWPIAGRFTISRGSKTVAEVIVAEVAQGDARGRGECVPYGRYGESIDSVMAQLESQRGAIEGGLDREGLQTALPPGAARNALDCALWDLEAKLAQRPVWELAGLPAPAPVTTAYTLSLDSAEKMGAAAKAQEAPLDDARGLLKALRLQGLEEDAVRQFVCKFSGPYWEQLYEALFGYEALLAARASRSR